MARKNPLLIGLALLLVLLIAAAVRGAVRDEVVVPLLYFVWGAQRLLDALPQVVPWTVLVLGAVLLAIDSLAGLSLPELRRRRRPEPPGRAAAWLRILRLTRRDEYSRWRLAQRLSQLAIEALVARDGITQAQARRRLEDPSLGAPAEVLAYLRAGMNAFEPRPGSQGRIVRGGPLDIEPERVLYWIESLSPEQPTLASNP
jgi:hypothetical protein